jgi:hypothetical protein
MDGKEIITLENLQVSKPRIFNIDRQLISIDKILFLMEGIASKIVIENYGGLKQISFYNTNEKIANYPLLGKRECSIEKVKENNEEIILITSF